MIQQNLNAKIIKQVFYNASLQPAQANTIVLTVENCHVNAFVEEINITFVSADTTASSITCTLLDRGNGYTGQINGFNPITYTQIGLTTAGTNQNLIINPANTQVNVMVNESVQDSEGIGNIYVRLSKPAGLFNVSFTLAVTYRPEITYNMKLNNRNQISSDRPQRVLSQTGILTYGDLSTVMVEQTNFQADYFNPRNNVDTATYGFDVNSTNPIFYFGTPFKTKRWFLGFSSDCTPNIGVVTFSYFNGANFVALASTQAAIGCQGPGTYRFAYDGVNIFTPPANWSAVKMDNDPRTKYNSVIIGLGTLATNSTINNPNMYWIQCQVGFATNDPAVNQTIKISSICPLIDPDLPLTVRRRLI